jgi:mRNA-degrading endonuclease toxin of MazEF toxin-antitoxin module
MAVGNGDIVWVNDLYKSGDSGRPAVIVGNSRMPDHGWQYVVVNLTSRSYHERSIDIKEGAYAGDPLLQRSHALPWVLQSVGREQLYSYLTRLTDEKLVAITETARSYIGADAT